jgi:hypothetical protein
VIVLTKGEFGCGDNPYHNEFNQVQYHVDSNTELGSRIESST